MQDEEIEMVFIQDNPMMRIKDADRPSGSFMMFPMRTSMDKVWYGTGIAYFSGLTYGGVYGIYRGLSQSPNRLFKVQLNSVINQTTRHGPWAANSLGVLALTWAIFDSIYCGVTDKNNYTNHVAAAFTTGFLFKSTTGVRQAMTSGLLLSSVVGAYGLLDAYSRKDDKIGEN